MSGLIRNFSIRSAVRALFLLATLSVPVIAYAHARSFSYSIWHWQEERAVVDVRIPRQAAAELVVGAGLERGAIGPLEAERLRTHLPTYVSSHLHATRRGEVCVVAPREPRAILGGDWFFVRLDVSCPTASSPLTLRSTMLEGVNETHVHLARLTGTEPEREIVLGGLRVASTGFEEGRSAAPEENSFFVLGIEHIVTGYDHLAFLFVLLLLVLNGVVSRERLRRVFWAITAFTVGHCTTFALATLGVISANANHTEILIALSVATTATVGFCQAGTPRHAFLVSSSVLALLCAGTAIAAPSCTEAIAGLYLFALGYGWLLGKVENNARVHAMTALVFGLIHGLAFASALGELGLSGAGVAWPLFQFNLGVEIGQIAAVLLILAPLALLLRWAPRWPMAPAWAHVAVFVLAAYWIGRRAG